VNMGHWWREEWYGDDDPRVLARFSDDQLAIELEKRNRLKIKQERERAAARVFGVSIEVFKDIQAWVLREEAKK
jgi:hypothetical protein